MFEVKVNGETLQVSKDELLSGYSRQEDYTRKTQDLAAQRQEAADALALFEALRDDPTGTLAQLTEWAAPLAPNPDETELERTVRELTEYKAQQESALQLAAVERELDEVTERHPDLDRAALLQHAVDIGANTLEIAARDMLFSDLHTKVSETEAEKAAAEERDAEAKASKLELFPMAGGRAVASNSVQRFAPEKKLSFKESAYEALKALGGE